MTIWLEDYMVAYHELYATNLSKLSISKNSREPNLAVCSKQDLKAKSTALSRVPIFFNAQHDHSS